MTPGPAPTWRDPGRHEFRLLASRLSCFATGSDIAQADVSGAVGPLAESAAQAVPNVSVSVTAVMSYSSTAGTTMASVTAKATLPFGDVAAAGARFLTNLINAKTIYDLGIAADAGLACGLEAAARAGW